MDENKDWLEEWKNKSQLYENKVKNHIKLTKDNVSNDTKKKSEKTLSIKPKLMYPVFFRIPKDMKRVIRMNSKSFTMTEYILLDWLMDEVLSFHWWEYKYQPKVMMKSCDIKENSFYKNLNKLKSKNIIRIVDTTKEDKSKRIYTQKKIILNPFFDTWNIKDMNTDIKMDKKQNQQDEEIKVLLDGL